MNIQARDTLVLRYHIMLRQGQALNEVQIRMLAVCEKHILANTTSVAREYEGYVKSNIAERNRINVYRISEEE